MSHYVEVVVNVLDLLEHGVPLTLLLDLVDPRLSSELTLLEERTA